MAERFCPYGKPNGHWVEDDGTGVLKHHRSMTRRWQCGSCRRIRMLPREKLEQMTEEERNGRRETARSIAKESEKGRKK